MTADDLAYASITELANLLRRREVSSEELVTAAIARTERLDSTLHTYITFAPDQALQQARAADVALRRGEAGSLLHGLPVSIKDHIDVAGLPSSAGARVLLGRVAEKDAGVTRRLRRAGAVIMGKANMNKFASGESGENADFGNIRTPWNTNFSAGGSSGGSAAMVAAGLVPLSVGSDNGGSIRIPAALCGVVGMKPTFGRVSIDGISPRAYSLDHAGPLTRSVEDSAIAMQVLAGHDSGDQTTIRKPVPDYRSSLSAPGPPLRIGVDRDSWFGQPAVLELTTAAVTALMAAGASIRDVKTPTLEDYMGVFACSLPEIALATRDLRRAHPAEFTTDDAAWSIAGEMVPAVDYLRGMQQRRALQARVATVMRDIDVLACPTYGFERRPFGPLPGVGGNPPGPVDGLRSTFAFNLLGLPAISVPCGFSADGFPIGLQLVGRAFDESAVFRAAALYERSTGWRQRRPSL